MPWKERRGHLYYYINERTGDRVVSRYAGRGQEAKCIAALLEEGRWLRESERTRRRRDREALEADDRMLADLCEAADLAAAGALRAAGFHRHHRGEWRRERVRRG